MTELETLLKSLVKGEYSSIYLTWNEDFSENYGKAEDWYISDNDLEDWVSYDEKVKAIKENSVWTLQWYPDTPIGSCIIKASSLEPIIEYLRKEND